jgi:predicted dehydrogenase
VAGESEEAPMHTLPRTSSLAALLVACTTLAGTAGAGEESGRRAVRLMTLDPGHFHAALVHREVYPEVDPRVDVYAPLGPDLLAHLARVAAFNLRGHDPTDWRLEVHTGPDFFRRMLREKPGNVVVISGRNRGKIEYVRGVVEAGLNALVDKPWILEAGDMGALEETLGTAERRGLIALDMMTERFEITSVLQRELVNEREVLGRVLPGGEGDPAVYMESVHHLMKTVAGAPNIRPAWFFDTAQQGEGLNDVGTHLVDLVQWTLFPEQALAYHQDVRVDSAQRWPTVVSEADFERVTAEKGFPAFLRASVRDGSLEYFANTFVSYTLRGIHVSLNVIWDWEAPPGRGDSHFASYRGSRARVEVRQGAAESYRPELYVVPNERKDASALRAAVARKLRALPAGLSGVEVAEREGELRIVIPEALRTSHEEHFGQVARRFFSYLRDPASLPAWERPNMLAKYWVTTKGIELARLGPPRAPGRRGARAAAGAERASSRRSYTRTASTRTVSAPGSYSSSRSPRGASSRYSAGRRVAMSSAVSRGSPVKRATLATARGMSSAEPARVEAPGAATRPSADSSTSSEPRR